MSVLSVDNATLNLYFNPLLKQGKWYLKQLPMRASIAMAAGAAVYARGGGNGDHDLVTASSPNFVGILMEKIASTDGDYATAQKLKYVAIPQDPTAEAEFKVGAGTFVVGDVGENVKFNDSQSVDVDTGGTQVHIARYLSSTRGVCQFNLAFT